MTTPLPRATIDPRPQYPSVHQSKAGQIWEQIVSKVWQTVKYLFLSVLGAVLFATNSTVFSVGFLIGAIWPEKARPVIERIDNLWKRQPWEVCLIGGTAAFLAIQVTGAFATLFFAVNLGIYISRK